MGIFDKLFGRKRTPSRSPAEPPEPASTAPAAPPDSCTAASSAASSVPGSCAPAQSGPDACAPESSASASRGPDFCASASSASSATAFPADAGNGRVEDAEPIDVWETELAEAETIRRAATQQAEPAITALSIEGPIWMRHGAPFSALLRAKSVSAPRFTVFGSTVVGNGEGEGSLQLSDAAGRLSRSLPLLMAEVIQIASEAVGVAMIPWAQGEGFALFFRPFEDEALCLMSGSGEDAPDYLIAVTVDVGSPRWQLLARLIRRCDGERLAEMEVELDGENPGAAIYQLCADLSRVLAAHAGVSMGAAPSWYQLPAGNFVAEYLVRLEQQLTVSCQTLDFLEGGGLNGEREILEGVLRLCVDQPKNAVLRMLYAQTLRLMNRVRPELVGPYREKTARLWRDYPMNSELEPLVFDALEEVFR